MLRALLVAWAALMAGCLGAGPHDGRPEADRGQEAREATQQGDPAGSAEIAAGGTVLRPDEPDAGTTTDADEAASDPDGNATTDGAGGRGNGEEDGPVAAAPPPPPPATYGSATPTPSATPSPTPTAAPRPAPPPSPPPGSPPPPPPPPPASGDPHALVVSVEVPGDEPCRSDVRATVRVEDADNNAVPGADVDVRLRTPDGVVELTAVSGDAGAAAFAHAFGAGSWPATVHVDAFAYAPERTGSASRTLTVLDC